MSQDIRERLVAVVVTSLLLISSVGLVAGHSSAESDVSPWSMFGGGLSNDGRSSATGGSAGGLIWNFTTDGSILSSPVIGPEGDIYVGSMDGYLYSFGERGDIEWKFNASAEIEASPAVDEEGNVYFGDVEGMFYALYPNGTEIWSIELDEEILSAPAITESGSILIADFLKIYSISSEGNIEWEHSLGGYIASSPAVDEHGGIYLGMGIVGVGQMHALEIDGDGVERNWTYNVQSEVHSSPALDENGNIYFGSFDGHLYSLYPNGTERWSFETGNLFTLSRTEYEEHLYEGDVNETLREAFESEGYDLHEDAELTRRDGEWYITVWGDDVYLIETGEELLTIVSLENGIFSSPSVGEDGTIYVGSNDNHLYAIDQSGEKEWRYKTDGSVQSSPLVDAYGNVYFGSRDNHMYSLNSDGEERWSFETEGFVFSSPAMDAEGNLYFGSTDGNLYSVGGAEDLVLYRLYIPIVIAIVVLVAISYGLKDKRNER